MQVNPWLVPIMSGEMRLQKPPLPYWFAAICSLRVAFTRSSPRALAGLNASASGFENLLQARRMGHHQTF